MILAAGRGARLHPLTENIPKCMVPIDGKPILERNIEWLKQFGVTEIIINLHHLPAVVMERLGDGKPWGIKITYSLEEKMLGTAGGVKRAGWFFAGVPFIVWYGDNLSTCNLTRLYAFHQARGALATIALFSREDVTRSGIVSLDENDRITRFLEKPQPEQVFSHWVNAGIYVLEPAVLDFIPSDGTPDFARDTFPSLLESGYSLYGYRMSADEGLWWIDTPEDLNRVQEQHKHNN